MKPAAALSLAVLLSLSAGSARGGDRITGLPFATRSEILAPHAMACTSHPLATQIALDIMKKGGTAADAAIAANAALGLMEPVSCGIGGDLFAIVWDPKSQRLYGLNGSGRAPKLMTVEAIHEAGEKTVPDFGPLPITVPGCVDGWFTLHERFGKLPLTDILDPTILYAKNGFPVTDLVAYYWDIGAKKMKDYPGFADTFLKDGRAPRKGELWTNTHLAQSLRMIALRGRDYFYKEDLAEQMDAFCRQNGCLLRKEDLAAHHSDWVEPISTNYRGYDVWELPPNGQGLAALQMLNILEGFDLKAMGHNSADFLHTLIEAKKIVYEDRARFYADPAFVKTPVERLLSRDYAAQRRKLIDPKTAAREYPAGDVNLAAADAHLREGDTIYLTVADDSGMMVSLIQSNYRGFGSGMCPGLGFGFQDRGAQFSLEDGHPNRLEPGKRPFHTIIPGFVTKDGKPWLSFGVMGGDMQPQGHVQVLCNIIDFGMSLQEAGDAARFYHTGSSEPTATKMHDGGTLCLESGVTPEVVAELKRRGHTLGHQIGPYGGYQAIRFDAAQHVWIGASESRKDGQAAGY